MKIIEQIKELKKDLVTWENFEGSSKLVSKKKKELENLISELNTNTNWLDLIESFDSFQENLVVRQENIEHKIDSINMSEFFKSEFTRLLDSCKPILSKNEIWEYCSDENFNLVIGCQNSKLEYIKECLLENGIETHGPKSVLDAKISDYRFFDIKNNVGTTESITESEKRNAKLKLTLLYKLGIIDHLRTFGSLKNNDRALSRLLHVLLEVGKPDTMQTYLSAERSGKESLVPQNNPLSSKLKQNAEQILERKGLTNDEIKKYYPNL